VWDLPKEEELCCSSVMFDHYEKSKGYVFCMEKIIQNHCEKAYWVWKTYLKYCGKICDSHLDVSKILKFELFINSTAWAVRLIVLDDGTQVGMKCSLWSHSLLKETGHTSSQPLQHDTCVKMEVCTHAKDIRQGLLFRGKKPTLFMCSMNSFKTGMATLKNVNVPKSMTLPSYMC
jgi:hypothetical protein